MSPTAPELGFVTALEIECRWLDSTGAPLLIEIAGIGRVRAAAAARRLLDRGATTLVSWGLAGGLDPRLAPGSVVVPDEVLDTDGGRWRASDDESMEPLIAAVDGATQRTGGALLCAPHVVASVAEKRALHERWGAVAVDMESAGIAEVAARDGTPWLAVRVVADAADRALPAGLADSCDDGGRLRIGAVARLLLRPTNWPSLAALGRAHGAAGRTMRRIAGGLGVVLTKRGLGAR